MKMISFLHIQLDITLTFPLYENHDIKNYYKCYNNVHIINYWLSPTPDAGIYTQ